MLTLYLPYLAFRTSIKMEAHPFLLSSACDHVGDLPRGPAVPPKTCECDELCLSESPLCPALTASQQSALGVAL